MIKTRINTTAKNLVRLLDALELHTEDFAVLAGVHRHSIPLDRRPGPRAGISHPHVGTDAGEEG